MFCMSGSVRALLIPHLIAITVIEGQGKAILYPGDVRAEPRFVNSIAHNPVLIEYTHGLKTLDNLYLDTSFIEDPPIHKFMLAPAC